MSESHNHTMQYYTDMEIMNQHYTGWLEASPWGIIEKETKEGQTVENIKHNDDLPLKYKNHLWCIQDYIDAFV